MTQVEKLLQVIELKGRACSYELTYFYGIKQAPTRKWDARKLGKPIQSVKCIHAHPKAVDYILSEGHTMPLEQTKEEYTYIFEGNSGRRVLKSSLKPEQISFV